MYAQCIKLNLSIRWEWYNVTDKLNIIIKCILIINLKFVNFVE